MGASWVQGEARRVVGDARTFVAGGLEGPVYLHFRRGELKASRAGRVEGFERASAMRLPLDRSDEDVVAWVMFEVNNLPCHP